VLVNNEVGLQLSDIKGYEPGVIGTVTLSEEDKAKWELHCKHVSEMQLATKDKIAWETTTVDNTVIQTPEECVSRPLVSTPKLMPPAFMYLFTNKFENRRKVYRGEDGLKLAKGHFYSDASYSYPHYYNWRSIVDMITIVRLRVRPDTPVVDEELVEMDEEEYKREMIGEKYTSVDMRAVTADVVVTELAAKQPIPTPKPYHRSGYVISCLYGNDENNSCDCTALIHRPRDQWPTHPPPRRLNP